MNADDVIGLARAIYAWREECVSGFPLDAFDEEDRPVVKAAMIALEDALITKVGTAISARSKPNTFQISHFLKACKGQLEFEDKTKGPTNGTIHPKILLASKVPPCVVCGGRRTVAGVKCEACQ